MHAGTQTKGVPEEIEIGRSYTIFDFFKSVLGGRGANRPATRILDFDPYTSREVYSGRAPPPPSNH